MAHGPALKAGAHLCRLVVMARSTGALRFGSNILASSLKRSDHSGDARHSWVQAAPTVMESYFALAAALPRAHNFVSSICAHSSKITSLIISITSMDSFLGLYVDILGFLAPPPADFEGASFSLVLFD